MGVEKVSPQATALKHIERLRYLNNPVVEWYLVIVAMCLCLAVIPISPLLAYSEPVCILPRPIYSQSIESQIVLQAWFTEVPPHLAFWLAMSESGLREDAVRHERGGSISTGVMQLNSRYFPPLSTADNIKAGVGYLAKQYRAYHQNAGCAVRAYRSGRVR